MRVLLVINQLHGGGAETSLLELLPALHDGTLAFGVAVLAPPPGGAPPPLPAGVPLFAPGRPARGRLRRVQHVGRVIRQFRPDLIHTTLFEADLAGAVAGRLARVPVIASLVNTQPPPGAFLGPAVSRARLSAARATERLILRRLAAGLHAISGAVAEDAVRHLRVDRRRIRVVARGRGLERLGTPSPERRARARARLGIDADAPMLLNIGREEPQKGQDALIDAVPLLRRRDPRTLTVIAGRRGRSSLALDRRIAELRIGDSIRRLGARDDVGDLLCAADVFVFPSLWEGLGGAVLEAMALDVPIVASDIPALREVLEGGACGLLVAPGAPDALCAAVRQILDDPASARERARRARDRFDRRYTLDAAVEGMRSLYLEWAPR